MLFKATNASWDSNISFWKRILFLPFGENHFSKHPARGAELKPRDGICGKAHRFEPRLRAAGLKDSFPPPPCSPLSLVARGNEASERRFHRTQQTETIAAPEK